MAAGTLLLCWLGGVSTGRAVGLAVAAAVVVLAVRVGAEDEQPWPQPAPRRTRPGRHTAVTTLRQLEGARRDRGDQLALRDRLARLERDGPHPAARAVREAVGGPAAGSLRRGQRPSARAGTTTDARTTTEAGTTGAGTTRAGTTGAGTTRAETRSTT